jgi:hypothetical protein
LSVVPGVGSWLMLALLCRSSEEVSERSDAHTLELLTRPGSP